MPTTARTPTLSGSSAATTPPNTAIRARKMIGAVSISDRCRSFSACSLTCRAISARPVTAVVMTAVFVVYSSVSASATLTFLSRSPFTDPKISACFPSSLFSGPRLPTLQYEDAETMPFSARELLRERESGGLHVRARRRSRRAR